MRLNPKSRTAWTALVLSGAAVVGVAAIWQGVPGGYNADSPADIRPAVNAQGDAKDKISFNRDIRPILSEKCFACHGPDAAVAKDAGGFRLDIRAGAIAPAPRQRQHTDRARRRRGLGK